MNQFTEELGRLIGDPTESWVQEAVFFAMKRNPVSWAAPLKDVMDVLMETKGIDEDEALDRVISAMRNGEVQRNVHMVPMFTVDPLTFIQLERRSWFWGHADEDLARRQGVEHMVVPAHLPNECAVVRAAVAEWHQENGEPPDLKDVIRNVRQLGGYDNHGLVLHVILNALDAGAVYCKGHEDDPRFFNADGWVQP